MNLLTWRRFADSEDREWDRLVSVAQDANPFQLHAWGEFRRDQGWEPQRWAALEPGGRTVGCLQALLARLPALGTVAWTPGGPLLGFPAEGPQAASGLVASWLARLADEQGLVYARFRSHAARTEELAAALGSVCAPPFFRVTTEHSLEVDLTRSMDELESGLSPHHRRNLAAARKAAIEWRTGTDPVLRDELALAYLEMFDEKGIRAERLGRFVLDSLCSRLGGDCFILAGVHERRAVTACLVVTIARQAFPMLWASSRKGRSVKGASVAMFLELWRQLKQRGCERLDLSGLAPGVSSHAGIDRFKRGFGGETVRYLGEWEWASRPWIRWAANLLVKTRKKLRVSALHGDCLA